MRKKRYKVYKNDRDKGEWVYNRFEDLPEHYTPPNSFEEYYEFIEDLPDFDEPIPTSKENNLKPRLSSIFKDYNKYKILLELMEDVRVTVGGVSIMKAGRGGKLFGVIDALLEDPRFLKNDYTAAVLLEVFNEYLGTNYTSPFNIRTKDYEESLDTAKRFLKYVRVD